MSLLLSNGKSQGQREKINALEITHYFDCIVASGGISVKKPSQKIFQVALEKLGGKPPEAIYVGDNPINDYIGSKESGMTPIWFSGFIE